MVLLYGAAVFQMHRLTVLSVILALIACSEEEGPPDAGLVDLGAQDLGVQSDAGAQDLGAPDLGMQDLGTPDAGPQTLSWAPCAEEEGAQCTTMIVPASWADPSVGTMELAVIRYPATSQANRIGALLIAAGSGGSGVDAASSFFTRTFPATGELLRRFDIVGIDTRGLGRSTPQLRCFNDVERASFLSAFATAPDDEALGALMAQTIESCRATTGAQLLPHFDMLSTTRDVELLRTLLGEEQLSIHGESYGAFLAAQYAVRYPERVRAAVLTASGGATTDIFEGSASRIRGLERALGGFFEWCDSSATCEFRPPTGTTQEAFDALVAVVVASPEPDAIPTVAAVLGGELQFARYGRLSGMLEALEMGDWGPLRASSALAPPGEQLEATLLTQILDHPVVPGTTLADWRAYIAALRPEVPTIGPLLGDRDLVITAAIYWEDPPDERFVFQAIPQAPPFLFVTGDFDPGTPREAAQTLLEVLNNDSALLDSGTRGHNTLISFCARFNIQDYLLDPESYRGVPTIECPEAGPNEMVVATASVAFPWLRDGSRVGESALGNLITDAMRASADAQLAMTNGGGIRAGLPADGVLPADTGLRRPDPGYAAGPPFDIIADDVREMFPFGNRIAKVQITGAQLHMLMEFGVSTYDGVMGSGEFFQISGFTVRFDPSAAPGARVQSITLEEDGSPIANDASASYSLALVDFVWYGGTGFVDFVLSGAETPEFGQTLDDALIDHLIDISLTPGIGLVPTLEGRIMPL